MARKPRRVAEPNPGDDAANIGNAGETGGTADSGNSGDQDAVAASGSIEPTAIAGNDDNGNDGQPVKRGRGRPRGSVNRTNVAPKPADINGLEKMLFGIHMILANIVAPEFGMPEDECSQFAKAIHDVNRHYGFRMLDQKTADWFHLVQTVAVGYGVRIMAIRERRKTVRVPTPAVPMQNGFDPSTASPKDIRTANIPGVGALEFPPDHPLSPRKPN